MISLARRRWWSAAALCCGVTSVTLPRLVSGQTVVVDGPTAVALPTLTPSLVVRALGFANQRPLRVRVQIATSVDFGAGSLAVDSSFSTSDTTISVQITRALPSEATVYWRASVQGAFGAIAESPITGPRTVPAWLTLISPKPNSGGIFDIRRPLFVWQSARITPAAGPWTYALEILNTGLPEVGVAGLLDTTFRVPTDLRANASYRWSVRASLPNGDFVRVASSASFSIVDPLLPTTTILYQNFPNPFPSATSFNTCFWFDIGQPGGTVSLDVLDLRGNVVRTIVPGLDGVTQFPAGRYGRGAPGAGSNCDSRFVWDGTASDGRTVAPGVYVARFRSGTGAPTFRRMLFKGR
ncbi:hypothetical protein [Gemmatimonas groenlandica]|uniref:FlgD Ig-like domain-containing protein n=1 Tax=Gemmatimonas groenlandica TaxID=2732249 RepID=A0A6M4IPU9_9BACT|nr:hypothetical protein [Gemmatimonas groenlandica]QJR35527.1 hypothetical protein HKW67_08410 [Gemmatimonas groenlandica]